MRNLLIAIALLPIITLAAPKPEFYSIRIYQLKSAEQEATVDSYLQAASILVDQALADEMVHEVILPILFLYRHAIELRLKVPVRARKPTHSLADLLQAVEDALRTGGHAPLNPGVVALVRGLDRFDPKADAFRFHARAPNPRNRKSGDGPTKVTAPEVHFIDEVWVDVRRLREAVSEVDLALERAARDLAAGSAP